jgi:hypothetical protein
MSMGNAVEKLNADIARIGAEVVRPADMSEKDAKAAFDMGLSSAEYQNLILKRPPPFLPDKQPLSPPKRPPGTVVPHPKPIEA